MNKLLETIGKIGIIPVIAIDDAAKAVPLAKALIAGGLPVAEVTFRTAEAEDAIKAISSQCPEMILGAGTVLTAEQLDRAVSAGAQFVVTPGFNPVVVKYAISKDVVIVPGTATAGEMEQAMAMGLDVVKFFPAEQNGGVAKLKALAGPYKNLKWIPTGGVNQKNLNEYLSFEQVLACGGTWMVKKDLIDGECWDEITAICKEAVRIMLGFRLAHVGINCQSREEAEKTAKLISTIFDFPYLPNPASVFSGTAVEVMDKGSGKNGHIGIASNNVERTIYYLSSKGVRFVPGTEKFTPSGKVRVIYLDGEIGGFTFHLVQQ